MFYAKSHLFGPVQAVEVGIAPTGKPIKSVYLYKVGSVIIDTGPRHLCTQVGEMLGDDKVTAILLTHHHEDHSGNAAVLERRFNVPVYLHPYGAAKLSRGFNILPYQHFLFGKSPRLQAQICPDTIEGESIRFKAVHTPGHSKDHTVYYVKKEGWLFSGDLWVGEKIKFFRADEQIDEQIESLQKIAGLDFEALFCGHRPCIKNGTTLIKRKLDYLISFRQQVIEFYQQGVDVKNIIKKMRKKSDLPIRLFTMGNISFSHMVKSSINSLAS